MTNSSHDTDFRTVNGSFTEHSDSIELPDETTDLENRPRPFVLRGESDLVGSARKVISKVEDQSIVKQTESLLSTIQAIIQLLKKERPELNDIPPLHAHVDEDGSVLLEWIFPDFRIGFNIEPNPDDSGFHMLTNKKLGERTESGQLANMRETIFRLLSFIISNI